MKYLIILLTLLFTMVVDAQSGSKTLTIGPKTNDNKVLKFNRNSSTPPQIRWNEGVSKLQFANDGSTFTDFASGSVANQNVNSYTTTQTLSNSNDLVLLDATGSPFTVTLHTAIGNSGKTITIKRTDNTLANVITLATTGGQTVGGTSTKSFYTVNESYTVVSDGANWRQTAHYTKTAETDAGALPITSGNGYAFTLSAPASITLGTIYTSGGFKFYVSATTAASTTLNCYGTGNPGGSGTLTFVSGSPSGNLTFNSLSANNPVKGAATYDRFVWQREGQYVNFRLDAIWAAGTAGSGDYAFILPTGLKIDMTNLTSSLQNGLTLTNAFLFSSLAYGNHLGAAVTGPFTVIAGNTDLIKGYVQNSSVYSGAGGTNLANAQSFSYAGRYPVVGWEP